MERDARNAYLVELADPEYRPQFAVASDERSRGFLGEAERTCGHTSDRCSLCLTRWQHGREPFSEKVGLKFGDFLQFQMTLKEMLNDAVESVADVGGHTPLMRNFFLLSLQLLKGRFEFTELLELPSDAGQILQRSTNQIQRC